MIILNERLPFLDQIVISKGWQDYLFVGVLVGGEDVCCIDALPFSPVFYGDGSFAGGVEFLSVLVLGVDSEDEVLELVLLGSTIHLVINNQWSWS